MHGRCSTSGLVRLLTDSYILRNEELFQIAPVEGPCMGGIGLVDWCICGPTCRVLKTTSCSRLNLFLYFFPTTKKLILLSASVKRFGVSRFFFVFFVLFFSFSFICIAIRWKAKLPIFANQCRAPAMVCSWCTGRSFPGLSLSGGSSSLSLAASSWLHRVVTFSCSGFQIWIVHAWEVFDWWTGALIEQLIGS